MSAGLPTVMRVMSGRTMILSLSLLHSARNFC